MKNNFSAKFFIFFIVSLVLVGCSKDGTNGLDGRDGTNGANGTDGTNGRNSLITTLIEQPGENCANGGFKIDVGQDTNDNGQLEANEVDATEFICNGGTSELPYLSYVSLINQTGTDNPETTVLENTLELGIVWTRESQGKYMGTLDKAIDIGKTVIFYTTPTTHTGVRGELVGDNQVRLELQNGINAFADDFSNLSFELREYE
ncbi:DUF7151 family protein [Flagellimonas pacifica]|uniref:DUF7151 domain-containing protein n=1 Tax=Flagellimonas pacifica TaxID=1247520 RepID=A0A285MYK5_9FLAO|nr:hypothetical protein [Allomuricauda parva]SNZ00571.1 hypothetical protein SAMN06265377_2395 [Allomuricauda parva]